MNNHSGTSPHPFGMQRLHFRREERVQWGVFAFWCLLFVLVTSVCVVQAIQRVGTPFPGFLFNARLLVVDYGDYRWAGSVAGLHYPDKLLSANNIPLDSVPDLEAVLAEAMVGEVIRYRVGRGEKELEFSTPTTRFTWVDWLLTFGIELLSGCIYCVMGIIVFVMKPQSQVSGVFLGACILLSLYTITGFDVVTSRSVHRLNFLLNTLVPASFVHLSMVFPREWKSVRAMPWLQWIPYGAAVALSIPIQLYFPRAEFVTYYAWADIYIVVGALTIVGAILYSYFIESSLLAMQRAKVLMFGASLALPIPAIAHGMPLLGASLDRLPLNINFLAIPIVLFPASIAYAIVKHNLFDVDVYIKRTVGYVLMTSIVAGAYFAFERVFKTIVLDPLLGDSSGQVYPFLFALLTVFAFNPVSQKVQQWVDKLFFRKGADFKMAVAGVSESLTSMVDVQAFIETIIHTVRTDLFIDRAGVVVVDARTNTCRSTFHGGKFGRDTAPLEETTDPGLSPDDPLLALLAREKKLITKYDVMEDPRYSAVRELCGQRFEELGASLVLPLFYHDQFSGALTLGYKKSGHFYTREDIDLLKTLSTMTSTAIEQSREKGQKTVLMQLFSKHVSPQVAESLWEQREQFLEGGRPKSQSMIVTAMFTDLQGFSTISEKQTPEVLMNWLNTYLDMMTTTVMEHGGVVDDFFGDGVKINFGVPIPRETEGEIRQDAINAVTCALAMEKKMIVLNGRMAAEGQQPLRMRIGLYTGPVVAGSLGSAERMKYTTIGDTVNTAARLESFDKDLVLPQLATSPCRILIGDSTLQHLGEQFETLQVGDMSLKGKATKITAHCVLGWKAGGRDGDGTG